MGSGWPYQASQPKHRVVVIRMTQVDQTSSSTAPRITCNRYRNTNGLDAPPLRASSMVSVATSISRDKNSSVLPIGFGSLSRNTLTALSNNRPNSTTSICDTGSLIPKP